MSGSPRISQCDRLIAFFFGKSRPPVLFCKPVLSPIGFSQSSLCATEIRIKLERLANHGDRVFNTLRLGEIGEIATRLQVILVGLWLVGAMDGKLDLFLGTQV